jgi:tripartite-type tricarboxylate transporter receptor subunit TctC
MTDRSLIGLWFISLISCSIAHAQSAPFYHDKTIRVVAGTTTGGTYDRWARIFARYMPKHIPGNPNMIVQNMPGAGSMVAANYLYTVAKPDGLTIGMFQNNLYLDELVGRKEAQFKMVNFNWIGTQEKDPMMHYIRADAPYKSIEDILRAKDPPKCSNSGTTDLTYVMTKILEETLGAKFALVSGYQGGTEAALAVEKGEVVCRTTRMAVHFSREPFLTWDKTGFDRHLLQGGMKRDPRVPDVPTIYELMEKHKTPEVSRRVAQVLLVGDDLGRPMVAPPGTPSDKVKILRDAYARALRDPELLAEAKKSNLDVDPTSGEDLQVLIKELMNQSGTVIERVKNLLR